MTFPPYTPYGIVSRPEVATWIAWLLQHRIAAGNCVMRELIHRIGYTHRQFIQPGDRISGIRRRPIGKLRRSVMDAVAARETVAVQPENIVPPAQTGKRSLIGQMEKRRTAAGVVVNRIVFNNHVYNAAVDHNLPAGIIVVTVRQEF